MGKKRKKPHKGQKKSGYETTSAKVVLVTALIDLTCALVALVNKLLE